MDLGFLAPVSLLILVIWKPLILTDQWSWRGPLSLFSPIPSFADGKTETQREGGFSGAMQRAGGRAGNISGHGRAEWGWSVSDDKQPSLHMESEVKLLESRRPLPPPSHTQERDLTAPSLGWDVRSLWKEAEVRPDLILWSGQSCPRSALGRKEN